MKTDDLELKVKSYLRRTEGEFRKSIDGAVYLVGCSPSRYNLKEKGVFEILGPLYSAPPTLYRKVIIKKEGVWVVADKKIKDNHAPNQIIPVQGQKLVKLTEEETFVMSNDCCPIKREQLFIVEGRFIDAVLFAVQEPSFYLNPDIVDQKYKDVDEEFQDQDFSDPGNRYNGLIIKIGEEVIPLERNTISNIILLNS